MFNGYHGGMGWGGWVLMALVMVTFWGLVVCAVLALVRRDGASSSSSTSQPGAARRILDQRLARGEIQLEEYRARREALVAGERADRSVSR